MRAIAILAFLAGILIALGGCNHTNDPPLPPGVTTSWPPDIEGDDNGCGLGIHYEDTFALTDVQLQTARDYVMNHCYGGPPPPGSDYYYHHD